MFTRIKNIEDLETIFGLYWNKLPVDNITSSNYNAARNHKIRISINQLDIKKTIGEIERVLPKKIIKEYKKYKII